MDLLSERKYYHMRIKYISGGETTYFYEVNKPKDLVQDIVLQIENLVPSIRFEGHRIYPKRINEYKIFETTSPSEISPDSVRNEHPGGYDYGGEDVTLDIATQFSQARFTYCPKCGAIRHKHDSRSALLDVNKKGSDYTLDMNKFIPLRAYACPECKYVEFYHDA